MAGAQGADVVGLRHLATTFDDAGDQIERITRRVDAALTRARWQGPAAARFRDEWQSGTRVRLGTVAETLWSSGGALRAYADAQVRTSTSDVRGGSGGAARIATTAADGTALPAAQLVADPDRPPLDVRRKAPDVDTTPREGQRQESNRNVGDSGAGTWTPEYGTPGPEPFAAPYLGPVQSGPDATAPEPPAWAPKDLGSDMDGPSWNTEDADVGDHLREVAVQRAADLASPAWPDAAGNLHHYLDNSGTTLTQPVDAMLEDITSFQVKVTDVESRVGTSAITAAREAGATVQTAYSVSAEWIGANSSESDDWFYATGSFDFNLTGQVTVHPPEHPGDKWRYELETVVNTRDRYNWDGNKSTDILWMNVSDAELQASIARVWPRSSP